LDLAAEGTRLAEAAAAMASGGPRTEGGKEVARWNATRHGIRSPAPVVPGLEKPEDWQEHREGVLESLSPEGHLELVLAERVALLSWRLHRVTRYETGAITTAQETIEDDIHERDQFLSTLGQGRFETTHPADIRFEAKYCKQNQSAFRRFARHRQEPEKVLKEADAGAVVFGVYIRAKKAMGGQIDLEALELPGVPEDADIAELPAMRVADVWGCVEAFAAAASLEPEELLEAATEEAGYEARRAAIRKEQVEGEISRKSRERILPGEDALQKIARYEAHLSRQLYQALHEHEALQARRSGGNAPLARLDVQGIPEG
jgi:hypothetical protein